MDNSKSQTLDFVDGYNALMIKAEEGDLREVQKLLADLKQPDVNAMNRNNTTALSLAAKNGHYRIVETLLSNGADPNIRNTSGQSPLFLACWNNFQDIVRLLIDNRAEVNTRDQRGWTPLMIAAFNGHKEIVRLLIERNADTTIQDCFGKSAVDRTKDPQILKLLQNSNKIARNYTDGGEGQKSGIFLINPSPNKVYTIEQMSALLKKASPLKETQESRGAHSYSATKTPSGNLKKSFTLGPNPPQFSNEKIAGSIDKSEYYTPQNRREPIGFRKNSDTKVATRFNRIREERSATSAEKSYRLASRSPIRSALVTSRTKESPNRSRIIRGATSRSTVTSSYNEVKKQALKEDIEKDLIGQVEHVSDKVQGLVFQKISLEVPKRMQSFERDLKKELNSLFQFRVDNMFKSLHASFNLKVKFCLNKMGYDTTHLDLTPFEESDPAVVSQEHKLFLEQLPHYDYGKEELAIEKDLHKLERSLSRGLLETDQSLLTSFVNTRESATHISFVNKSELVSNLYEQLGQEVRQSTEYLMEFSNGKINDVMREETNRIYQGMIAALNRNMDYVEEDFKNNFDSIVTQKINELLGSLGKPPASAGSSAGDKAISPEITPSKPLLSSFPKTTVDKRITFSQEFGSGIRDDKSVLSSVELTSSIMRGPDIQSGMQMNTSGYKETDFSQTKSKIQRLKNSLNFIDEEKQPAPETQEERPRERGTGSSQLEKNVLIQDNTQSTVSGDEQKRPASFMDSIKKEYYENIQAAAKLDELKSYYQKKNDQGSVSYGRDQGVAQNTRYGQAGEKRPPFK